MGRLLSILVYIVCAATPLTPAAAEGSPAAPGKAEFVRQKCTRCHSAPGVKGGKHDLAKVGTRHDAATLEAYLLKQAKIDGKKHKKKAKASPAEIKSLAKWLASLK